MKNRLTRYNNGYITNNDSTKSISEGIVGLNKKNTYFSENYLAKDPQGQNYTPPSEWVSLPSFAGLTQYFAGVFAVYNTESNFVTLQINTSTGNYIVDWGDGTTGSFADNAIAYKQYTQSSYAGLTSTVYKTYKTVLIQAWPVSGTILECKLNNSHNQSGLNAGYFFNWLNIKLVGSSCTNVQFDSRLRMLEQIDYVGSNSMTTQASRFVYCVSLVKIVNWDTTNSTNFSNMFLGCRNLKEIPSLNSSKVTNITGMFNGCANLNYIPWMDTSNVTSLYETFFGCVSLKTIPPINTSKVTDMYQAFRGCLSPEDLPWMDLSKVTAFDFCFYQCIRLKKIPKFTLRTDTNINLRYMFYACSNLREIPNLNYSKSISFIGFAAGCPAVVVPETLDVSNSSNLGQIFYENYVLKKAPIFKTGNNYASMAICYWNCVSLEEVPAFDTSKITSFNDCFYAAQSLRNVGFTFYYPTGQTWATSDCLSSTFRYCTQLRSIGISDVSGLSGAAYANVYNNMFLSCDNLTEVGLSGISENFSIASCSLGPTALNDLYTRLAVVGASGAGAKTITVSGNWGTASDNPNIAIAKGWTVSG